jgi:hypothetical protein
MVPINPEEVTMLSPVVLPVPAALAVLALLVVIAALGTLQARLEKYVEDYRAWQWKSLPPRPAPAPITIIEMREVTADRPFALPSPVGRPVPVVPGRHRLDDVLERKAPVYRPQAWPADQRVFVGALRPISARPYIDSAPVSAPPALGPAVIDEPTGELELVTA